MAQAPAMPLFTDALLGDTQHLSLEEFGAYLKLLIIDWRQKPKHIPDDDLRISRMLGISVRRWRTMKPTICDGQLYRIVGQKFRQKRLDREWAYVQKKIETNRANAKRKPAPKSLNSPKTASATARAKPPKSLKPKAPNGTGDRTPTHTHTHKQESTTPPDSSTEPRAPTLEAEVGGRIMDMLTDADPNWATRSGGIHRQWLADGADPEAHIYPVIRQAIDRGQAGKISTLSYFTEAVRRLVAERPVRPPDPSRDTPRAKALRLAQKHNDEVFELRISAELAHAGPAAADTMGGEYLDQHRETAHGAAQEA
jgi:uncharacterized protein YdaU (DUF1376 family)